MVTVLLKVEHSFLSARVLVIDMFLVNVQGVSKKCNTFDLKYLKDGSIKLIVFLVFSIAIQFFRVQF